MKGSEKRIEEEEEKRAGCPSRKRKEVGGERKEIETFSSLLMRLLRTKQNLIKMQIASSFTIGVKCRFLSQGDKSLPKPFLGLVMAPRTSLEKTLKRLLVRFPPSELLFPLSSASVEFGDTDKLVRLILY